MSNLVKNSFSIYEGAITFVTAVDDYPKLSFENEVHIHYDQLEIYRFLDGDLYFSFEGQQIPVENGDMIIIDSGTLHRPIIKTSTHYERKRILVNKSVLHQINTMDYNLYSVIRNERIFILKAEDIVSNGIDKIFDEIEKSVSNNTPHENFYVTINIFLLLLKAVKYSKAAQITQNRIKNQKTAKILEYINHNLTENLNYSAIAERFFISEKYLYKIFKKETGFTLSNYIKERRLLLAMSLLDAGHSAAEAAEESGFNDYSAFYRTFVKKTGVTPNEYSKNK